MDRKRFITISGLGAVVAATAGVAGCVTGAARGPGAPPTRGASGPRARRGVHVPIGEHRTAEDLMIWGAIPLQVKVSTEDTGGSLFVFEHADMGKGGPPRHLHHEQDEWFYVQKGEFAFEVGDERFTLRPGDSLFAPRMVPHAWAYVGEGPGTLLLAVQPAGSLEAFFLEACEMTRLPTPEEAARAFAAHGMEVVGPPLGIG